MSIPSCASCSFIEEFQDHLRKHGQCAERLFKHLYKRLPSNVWELGSSVLTSPFRLWAQHLLWLFFWLQMKIFCPDLCGITHSMMHLWVPTNIYCKFFHTLLTLLELRFCFWLTFTACFPKLCQLLYLWIKLTHCETIAVCVIHRLGQ